ncbi:hypothetical protein [Dinoroseobacter sp. S124A]|uniref:hypothetical protein n=1 Tax=Dinoroseobacter sp. S124A TaxID=3415128 RepID=UPI003C799B10
MELNPNSAFGYYNSATLQTVLCAGKDADQNVARALFLSPMDPHLQSMFGTRALAAFVTDDLAAAIRYSDRAVAAPNPHLYVFMIAAAVYNRAGHEDKARACVDRIRALNAPFGKTDFLTHFNLRDPDRLAALSEAFDSLDI